MKRILILEELMIFVVYLSSKFIGFIKSMTAFRLQRLEDYTNEPWQNRNLSFGLNF